MTTSWNTKYGRRRLRQDQPTIAEALSAAQCFADDPEHQIALAADLLGVAVEEVRGEMKKMLAAKRRAAPTVSVSSRSGATRTVVVERKAPRRMMTRVP
ncbi:hypothetical protein [Methylovirgula sp. 4M-Z18]|uniref:hypothetical protein n=1 Tax=Methylovirgula sp. 4M-Z18 TaxID=2293567 RepID=UPI000E2FC6F3|nr:hypothetical protein [Methylovirgula sp. 4M-Z18]RFB81215.1 hypothetical protein DYH55_07175 [Methylovirgula sp. 4M-Z18]